MKSFMLFISFLSGFSPSKGFAVSMINLNPDTNMNIPTAKERYASKFKLVKYVIINPIRITLVAITSFLESEAVAFKEVELIFLAIDILKKYWYTFINIENNNTR